MRSVGERGGGGGAKAPDAGGGRAKSPDHRHDDSPAMRPGGSALSRRHVLSLQRAAGNAATGQVLKGTPVQRDGSGDGGGQAAPDTGRVAFVREQGLNLRTGADRASESLAQLPFGQRIHLLDGVTQSGWQKTAVLGRTGYVAASRIHRPPAQLIDKDPGLRLVRVRSGQTFWGLVKEMYGIQGNEGTADQNINHFINAIRAVNKPEAFTIRTDLLDDVGNALISGRDASDTELIAGVDLWVPSFGVAAAMDVGSGTVTGEVARIVKKIQQKIEDFAAACRASGKHIPDAIARRAGEMGEGLLHGLIEFAKEAATILAVSTAVGALIGSLFGGVGAIPGAEVGFEIGLLILEVYGLFMLVEAVLGVAGNLLSQLGRFISLVWTANGDPKQIEEAGKTLADALGILVSAVLAAIAAYLLKKGGDALRRTRFARTVGEKPLARWLADRQRMTTTRETFGKKDKPPPPDGTAHLPEMRQRYIAEVEALAARRDAMRAAGESAETIARKLHAERRALGEKYKDLTPEPLRSQIYERNLQKYGDKLGPSIEWLRGRGKSWDDIIESATRSGGADLGLGKK